MNWVSAEDAISAINSGDHIFIHSIAAAPQELIAALMRRTDSRGSRFPMVTRRGESRIVPFLKPGAGVVTTRAHGHYVVTEYSAVNLYGQNLRQRARALIEIAHPTHRAQLERVAYERFKTIERGG